jgi:hypothetical protein
MNLPTEILDNIAILSNDYNVAQTLRPYITDYAYWSIAKNTLIYGEIQSGKTKEIIKILKNDYHKKYTQILVVQNSLLVLNQYKQRLTTENINFQVIDSTTTSLNSKILIVMNNVYRYEKLLKLLPKNEKYILLMDEADLVVNNCPLKNGIRNYYITATPYFLNKKVEIHHIIEFKPPKEYYGIKNLIVQNCDLVEDALDDFFKEPSGMILINAFSTIGEMNWLGKSLAVQYPNFPIIILNSEKHLFLKKTKKIIKQKSINKIIDNFADYSHIILIADRCASRGLSFTSSDYSRHLTHQIVKIKSTVHTFLQSLRICGNYKNKTSLKLYINDEKNFNKYYNFITNFNLNSLLIQNNE